MKMENIEEFNYFKNQRGITKLRNVAIISYVVFGLYLIAVAFNIETLLRANRQRLIWQNFEGMIVYGLSCI